MKTLMKIMKRKKRKNDQEKRRREYRVVRQSIGVPMVEYTKKAYLLCIDHAIRMCMCKAMALSEEEGICIFHTGHREHPRDYDEIHHSFDRNSPCQYTRNSWPRIP